MNPQLLTLENARAGTVHCVYIGRGQADLGEPVPIWTCCGQALKGDQLGRIAYQAPESVTCAACRRTRQFTAEAIAAAGRAERAAVAARAHARRHVLRGQQSLFGTAAGTESIRMREDF